MTAAAGRIAAEVDALRVEVHAEQWAAALDRLAVLADLVRFQAVTPTPGRDLAAEVAATVPPPDVARFTVGTTYTTGEGRDYVWRFRVTGRSARFVTVEDTLTGEARRVGVRVHNGTEVALPLGTYAQAPGIAADRPYSEPPPGKSVGTGSV